MLVIIGLAAGVTACIVVLVSIINATINLFYCGKFIVDQHWLAFGSICTFLGSLFTQFALQH